MPGFEDVSVPVGAPYWRRAAAGAIDAAIVLGGLSVGGFTGVWLLRRLRWRPLTSWPEDPETLSKKFAQLGTHGRVIGVLWAVGGRNWRSPGRRLLHLRRADAKTGGPVTVRSALIAVGLDQLQREAGRRIAVPRMKRSFERMSALQPRLKEIQRTHANDQEAQQEALMAFYEENEVNPARSCVWLLPGIILPTLPGPWSARRQTWVQWLAGTVVVLDSSTAGASSPSRPATS